VIMKFRFSWVPAGSLLAFPLLLAAAYFAFEIYVFALPAPDLARASRSSTIVLAENRRLLTTYLAEDDMWRLPVTVRDVPSRYLAMLIAYEDRRFFEHRGIDIWAVLRAGFQWLRHGRIVSGASTLTMQTVRLLEKDKPASIGKLRQAALAVKLERALDKEAILSLYLTLAPFGGNIEGVRAASLRYFGIEPPSRSPNPPFWLRSRRRRSDAGPAPRTPPRAPPRARRGTGCWRSSRHVACCRARKSRKHSISPFRRSGADTRFLRIN
jgi:penicillin-binding protein 1C